MALLLVSLLAGATWSIENRRGRRALAAAAAAAVFALNLPSAGIPIPGPGGIRIPQIFIVAAAAAAGWLVGRSLGRMVAGLGGARRMLAGLWIGALPAVLLILTDFKVGIPAVDPKAILSEVQPSLWSGMLLTLVLSTVSILLSFPFGVLLALGRMSRLPVIRVSCVTVIEVVRGVPLITILFMAQVMLPMFLPMDLSIDRVVRAIAGLTIFTAAYLAEVVRGGLQAVPHEQLQAARALGLNEFLVTALVLLPQALRLVIPAIMGQFVSIFKDTSLIAIVGLLELLGILGSITKQREYIGTVREVYLFAAAFYFVVAYAMSVASRRVEKQLGVGTR
jgi:general L-amino acid transport system permease protein